MKTLHGLMTSVAALALVAGSGAAMAATTGIT
ncbi:MAG: hypothetical protein JWO83_4322, partial [Caulobacteraceae bacterium]|nr:hypothetical protein [Caulobacteraceae bacterium]